MSCPLPRQSGFTLIELLVVISIIAILASMLLPAVGMIRDMAQATKCASNQRQLALGVITYAQEHDGQAMRFWTYAPVFNTYRTWHWGIAENYVEGNDSTLNIPRVKSVLYCTAFNGTQDPAQYNVSGNTGIGINTLGRYFTAAQAPAWPGWWAMYDCIYTDGPYDFSANDPQAIGMPIDKVPSKASRAMTGDVWNRDNVALYGNMYLEMRFMMEDPATTQASEAAEGMLNQHFNARFPHRGRNVHSYWDGHTGSITIENNQALWNALYNP